MRAVVTRGNSCPRSDFSWTSHAIREYKISVDHNRRKNAKKCGLPVMQALLKETCRIMASTQLTHGWATRRRRGAGPPSATPALLRAGVGPLSAISRRHLFSNLDHFSVQLRLTRVWEPQVVVGEIGAWRTDYLCAVHNGARAHVPEYTGYCTDVGSMLGRRLRRRPNIEPTPCLLECNLFIHSVLHNQYKHRLILGVWLWVTLGILIWKINIRDVVDVVCVGLYSELTLWEWA